MSYRLELMQIDHHQHRIHNRFFFTTESHAWGLNFVSEEEAKKFLEFCSVCIILFVIQCGSNYVIYARNYNLLIKICCFIFLIGRTLAFYVN